MPLFNRFPYTNFHELNLNWILEQIPIVKKYRDETEELHDDTKVLHDDTQALHDNTKVLHDNVIEQHKEITAEITQGKKDISDLTTTGKHEISDLTDESKHAITDLTTSGKNELNTIITNGTNQLDTLIDTGKADIKTLTDSGKSTIETATSAGKAEITNTVTDGKAQITTSKDGALEAIGTAKDSATTTIKNLESSATSAITAKGDLYLHQIADEGKKQTDAVTAEGVTQITNITQLGDTYKTEMTTLKNDAQTSADNAKEYAETAKTLKPMYWGGDIDNYDATTNLWDACLYFSDASLGKTRHANVVIQENDNYSPNPDYVWYAHLTLNTNTTVTDKVFIVAFNYDDGNVAFGRYVPQQNRIFWNTISSLELESAWNATTGEITNLVSTTYGTNNITIPVGLENSPDATKAFFAKVTAHELGVSSDLLAWSKDGDMYVGHVAVGDTTTVTWNKTVNLDEIHGEIVEADTELQKQITKNKNDLIAVDNKVSSLATVATTGSYNDLKDTPNIPTNLATVATTGSYNDLIDKPTIPVVTNDLTNELKENYDYAYNAVKADETVTYSKLAEKFRQVVEQIISGVAVNNSRLDVAIIGKFVQVSIKIAVMGDLAVNSLNSQIDIRFTDFGLPEMKNSIEYLTDDVIGHEKKSDNSYLFEFNSVQTYPHKISIVGFNNIRNGNINTLTINKTITYIAE